MHHAEIVFLELRPEITGKLDAVKFCAACLVLVVAVNLAGLGVVVDVERQSVDLTRKRSITGGRFKDVPLLRAVAGKVSLNFVATA